MKYDTANLAIVTSTIATIVYDVVALIGAIISLCVGAQCWSHLFVWTAVGVLLADLILCVIVHKSQPSS